MPPPLPPAICPRCHLAGKGAVVHRDGDPCPSPVPRPKMPTPGASPKRENSAEQRAREAWAAAAAEQEERERAEKEAEAEVKRRAEVRTILAGPSSAISSGPLDIAEIAVEAAKLAPGPFGFFLWVDVKRIAYQMPPISNWWRWSIGQFYASGKPWGWWEVGRGGGKSTTLECVAAERSLFGARKVPPGQTWSCPFISVGPEDANRRVDGIAAVYKAIGLPIVGEEGGSEGKKVKKGEGVQITRAPRASLNLVDARGNPISLGSVAGTVGNVSGPSTFFAIIDEAAKLHDKGTNAHPLTELVASLSQTSRARPGWMAIVCSSAWERFGLHFAIIDAAERGEEGEANYIARIGDDFMEETLRGFYDVAALERARGDREASDIILKHAKTLTPRSPHIPTHTANPTLGNPDGPYPWGGAAVASRKLVDVMPETALDGVPRSLFWLRENGSVALSKGARGSLITLDDARYMAEQNHALQRPWTPQRKTSEDGMFDYGPAEGAAPARWKGL